MKLVIEEQGSDTVEAAVADADGLATSLLALVETRAALARARSARRIDASEHRALLELFAALWEQVGALSVDQPLVEEAAQLAQAHGLRAYDAVHLASALILGRAESTLFACWDLRLGAAAAELGLPVLDGGAQ